MSKEGTGDEFVRIDLGEVGDLIIEDDGFEDSDVNIRMADPDGATQNPSGRMSSFRSEHDDVAFEAELLDGAERHQRSAPASSSFTSYSLGPFVCDDCERTFPGKRNQTPDQSTDLCPDCAG